ncbi:MAG TPA: protein phosphatase CheZ [Betaproteobacteria bacterium]|nr:protein phosphatase CheZ [Betaproteobacteria bacterium]
MSNESGDSAELEDLFDSIAQSYDEPPAQAEKSDAASPLSAAQTGDEEDVYSRIGHLTRGLHETLRQLGYDKSLEEAASVMPDTRERLNYIANLTEQAAVRALNAAEKAKPIQEALEAGAQPLAQQWQAVFDNKLGVEEFKALAAQTRDFLQGVPTQTQATNAQLMEIIMAQDFQDLTGQVIKKVVTLAQDIEQQLLQLLVASTPPEKKSALSEDLLNGPVVNAEGRSDIVTSQEQVDELLESLGF